MSNDAYLDPYRDVVRRHGPVFDATLWATTKTQQLRFDVLTQMAFLAGKRVLDAGCALGDFARFLLDRDVPYEHYIGIDGLPEVIEEARRRGLPRTEFHAGDFAADASLLRVGEPQVTVISGALNTMSDETALSVLEAAWRGASETLAFNFLSDCCDAGVAAKSYPARRLPTMKLIEWALSHTARVRFRQDYFPNGHDATILMQKG